ncbi:MAG: hypothetical protein HON94_09040 [Methylococcales bacterium]|jgi:hypothetical protein|nr:hypothetical protein [Methylococcales bacterium]MBT7410644.1 hypothetical protein [Methylococcales bacterium]
MILNITINENPVPLEIPEFLIEKAADFFEKVDKDLDSGWQMSREWVSNPTLIQRCQIAMDKILSAIETNNQQLAMLMAAYIVSKIPDVKEVIIGTTGDISENQIITVNGSLTSSDENASNLPPTDDKIIETASEQISKVYKMGRAYYFASLNPSTEQWEESPAIKDEEKANKMRDQKISERVEELRNNS